MNIKNLSLLMAFACAAPVYATPEIDETQKTLSDRQKEDRACSNMAFSELSVVGGIFAGIATSIASGSTAAGLAVFATPLCGYAYLRHNYKKMFSKEAYTRVINTERYTFDYGTCALIAPVIMLTGTTVGLIAGNIIGTMLGNIGIALKMNADIVKLLSLAASAAIPTLIEAKNSKYENKRCDGFEKIQYYSKHLAYAAITVGAVCGVCTQYKL